MGNKMKFLKKLFVFLFCCALISEAQEIDIRSLNIKNTALGIGADFINSYSYEFIDVDNDGDTDMHAQGALLLNDGEGRFSAYDSGLPINTKNAAFADFDVAIIAAGNNTSNQHI